jgi:RimJ/RimL family protein N-acetyltransferase
MFTERLELRLPVETDRRRFVELFTDDEFMVFSGGMLDEAGANDRFDKMLMRAGEMAYAKQPVIVRSTAQIIGYVGVDRFEFEGASELEFGWRLVPEARGTGCATEAAGALLGLVESSGFVGTIHALIESTNLPSQNVAAKLGFAFWKDAVVNGYLDGVYRRRFGEGGESL